MDFATLPLRRGLVWLENRGVKRPHEGGSFCAKGYLASSGISAEFYRAEVERLRSARARRGSIDAEKNGTTASKTERQLIVMNRAAMVPPTVAPEDIRVACKITPRCAPIRTHIRRWITSCSRHPRAVQPGDAAKHRRSSGLAKSETSMPRYRVRGKKRGRLATTPEAVGPRGRKHAPPVHAEQNGASRTPR